MKKNYLIPSLEIIVICEAGMIAQSMKIGGTADSEKVSTSSDIGFVKEQKSRGYDVWNEDWSK